MFTFIKVNIETREMLKEIRAHIESETEFLRLLFRRQTSPSEVEGGTQCSPLGVGILEAMSFIDPTRSQHPLDPIIEETRKRIDQRLSEEWASVPFNLICNRLDINIPTKHLLAALLVIETNPNALKTAILLADESSEDCVSIGFYLRLFRFSLDEINQIKDDLSCLSPLRLLRVVMVHPPSLDEVVEKERYFFSRGIRLATGVVNKCIGNNSFDEWLTYDRITPTKGFQDLFLPKELCQELESLVGDLDGLRLMIYGPYGVGKKSIAEALGYQMGRKVLVCRTSDIPDESHLALAFREAVINDDILFFDCGNGEKPKWAGVLRKYMNVAKIPIVFGGEERLTWESYLPDDCPIRAIPIPDAGTRVILWKNALPNVSKDVSLDLLGSIYSLTAGMIQKAAKMAQASAVRRNPVNPVITRQDVLSACERIIYTKSTILAQRIPPGFTWDDIILPEETKERLLEFLAIARNKKKVYEDWGFGRKMPYGRGISALFYGPPGTGKTMAASVIASELGVQMLRIDLSQVVNKFVGETEKNIGRVFDEACDTQALLLFDEADALFTRRTEVHTSIDRYANLEVNYLLQRMEEYEGVTILTTNFKKAIDEAFERRIKIKVEFPFPDRNERAKLWQIMIPKEAPVTEDVDWWELAEFELSGGHIKNAILRAATRAADQGRAICHKDFADAAIKELKELGHIIRRSEDEGFTSA